MLRKNSDKGTLSVQLLYGQDLFPGFLIEHTMPIGPPGRWGKFLMKVITD